MVKVATGPVPNIKITKPNGKFNMFRTTWYEKYQWLTGSLKNNRLCWPCLLMGKSQTWSVRGFNGIRNLDGATKCHNKCKNHTGATVRLKLLGRVPLNRVVAQGVLLQTGQNNAEVHRNSDDRNCLHDATADFMQGLAFHGHIRGPV